ncbi:extracellular solute-binding protein [Paenibacillus cremeus]|uniref:Extracellular solute-binding protein n=1 Tax=Paenibacillus cremeus TaxID=2163881 RepID=A0A559K626_9BACL|nr:extracellular solute-binding protein [Paenibacillus cremeus]TVY07546.1 extracellular solute-binding protein [Paenibacillus cremeus]
MLRKKSIQSATLGAFAGIVLLAGCSSASPPPGASGSPSVSENATSKGAGAPTEINILTTTYNSAPGNDLDSLKQINEKFNVKINVTYVPANNYTDKLNVMLAAGDLPDVTMVWDINTQTFANAINQGAFWDLTPYIKNYPNLAAYPQQIYTNVAFKGKTMGIPRVRPTDGHESLLIRQDWLDKLGLKAPKTMDEFFNVMEAFTKQDPDGNGKNDTYGFVGQGSPTLQNYFISMFGNGFTHYIDESGQIQPSFFNPKMKDALTFWNKVNKAGVMVPDLPLLQTSQIRDFMTQDKAGMGFSNVYDGHLYTDDIKKVNPKAVIVAYEFPAAPDGKRYYEQAPGSFGVFLINKKVSEDKLKKILDVYNYTATREVYNLVAYGIKDLDYKEAPNGDITQTDEGKKKGYAFDTSAQWVSSYFDKYVKADLPGMTPETKEYNHKLVDSIMTQSVPNYGLGLVTPTALEKSAEWNKKINDMMVNVIIGKNSMDDWDKFVKSFKDDPIYQKHLKELNELYKERTKK